MTFSLLAKDSGTGAIGGAAATGSLCVGGWVLRGAWGKGISASQGAAPSTLWGENVLDGMAAGLTATDAVAKVTGADAGRAARQLSALDMSGGAGVHSGSDNSAVVAERLFDGGVAAGNMLASADVADALADGYLSMRGDFALRLLAGLRAAEAAGSDFRGLQSAALLILHPDRAPLTLRVDFSDDPLTALETLHRHATTGDYADWTRQVPTINDPERVLD
ncbi:DUF1028 domain-containing protein [Mesobacterium pallidum]|uniref:DUF1028 domain-containing protein n=1 Tax=Mesobacterium pallidum TaxID=2872037 RepID=UPI001EE2818A|nr:DUF1028 domain-containing protein [Mesobacterium pallidum]